MTSELDHAKNTLAVAKDLKKLMVKHKIQYLQLDDYGDYIDFNGADSHLQLSPEKSLGNKTSFIDLKNIDNQLKYQEHLVDIRKKEEIEENKQDD